MGPSSAKSYDSRQHYFQQSGCIRRPDAAGTSQRYSLQGGTTHPEKSTYTGRRQTPAHARGRQRIQKNSRTTQLDLPEHLWTVRNMDMAPVREQHFMAISSEVEVLRQQLKGKGMYPAPPNYTQINQQNVHFQPIQPAKLSPLQPLDRLFLIHCLARRQGHPDRNQTVFMTPRRIVTVHTLRYTHHPRAYQNSPFREHHM